MVKFNLTTREKLNLGPPLVTLLKFNVTIALFESNIGNGIVDYGSLLERFKAKKNHRQGDIDDFDFVFVVVVGPCHEGWILKCNGRLIGVIKRVFSTVTFTLFRYPDDTLRGNISHIQFKALLTYFGISPNGRLEFLRNRSSGGFTGFSVQEIHFRQHRQNIFPDEED
ncbi:hypothetical protein Bhyg_07857 [Pseudolycoriella hygida]|uniref:Uncharacterized protein n=1 Tax=Pseudolycoriella hygida TaxID=35572 RepID=A0A9Q0N3T7_9DIPT|nr:hypothetical protein Bhyg_07857 [Pseudolycoriella hygida]